MAFFFVSSVALDVSSFSFIFFSRASRLAFCSGPSIERAACLRLVSSRVSFCLRRSARSGPSMASLAWRLLSSMLRDASAIIKILQFVIIQREDFLPRQGIGDRRPYFLRLIFLFYQPHFPDPI